MRQASARKDKNKEGPVCYKNKEEPACSSSGPFVCFRRVVDFSGAKTSKSVREEVGDIFDISAMDPNPPAQHTAPQQGPAAAAQSLLGLRSQPPEAANIFTLPPGMPPGFPQTQQHRPPPQPILAPAGAGGGPAGTMPPPPSLQARQLCRSLERTADGQLRPAPVPQAPEERRKLVSRYAVFLAAQLLRGTEEEINANFHSGCHMALMESILAGVDW